MPEADPSVALPVGILSLIVFYTAYYCCFGCDDHGTSDAHVSVLPGSIPVVDLDSQALEDGVECAVCLSLLAETKLLTCNHRFHAHCIDTWLQSHSTCPTCRESVGSVLNHNPGSKLSPIQPEAVTQDANSRGADVTEVVVNIPASHHEIGESGLITAPNEQAHLSVYFYGP